MIQGRVSRKILSELWMGSWNGVTERNIEEKILTPGYRSGQS
jgi:hypothetical protein